MEEEKMRNLGKTLLIIGIVSIVLAIFVLLISSQMFISITYRKYSSVSSSLEISGRETAQNMLARNGVHHVSLRYIKGTLNDHYNSSNKTINLSHCKILLVSEVVSQLLTRYSFLRNERY